MTQSLHDLEKSLFEISKNEQSGFVSISGSQDILFEYSSSNTSASLQLTELGKKFFNVSANKIKGLNPFEFANYLGVKADSASDLTSLLKVDDARSISNEKLLKYAAESGSFSVAKSIDELPEQFRRKHCSVLKSMVVREGSSKSEAKSVFESNVVRTKNGVSESDIYLQGHDGIARYSAKFSSSRDNQKLMILEHAALVALGSNKVMATNSSILKGDSGEVYLLKQKVDSAKTMITKENEKHFQIAVPNRDFYASASWSRIVATGSQNSGHIDAKSATNSLIESALKNKLAAKSVLTMHCFNVLIGNNNVTGATIGVQKSLIGGSTVSNRVAHAFDVAPSLMLNSSKESRKLHSEKSLKTMDQGDCYSIERISPRLVNEVESTYPGILKEAFDTAVNCRNDMERYIKNELVSDGHLSKSEANEFSNFISYDPSGAISIAAKSPFKESSNGAMDRFAKKKIELEENLSISCR